jgi:hypothetical protein
MTESLHEPEPQRVKKIAGSMMAMPSSLSASPRRSGGASSTIMAAKTTVAIPNPTFRSSVTAGQYERHRLNDYVEERGKAQEQKPDGEEQPVTETVQDAGHPDLREPRREHEHGRHESWRELPVPTSGVRIERATESSRWKPKRVAKAMRASELRGELARFLLGATAVSLGSPLLLLYPFWLLRCRPG